MTYLKKSVALKSLILSAVAFLCSLSAAFAQTPPQFEPQKLKTDYSDKEVKAFIVSANKVTEVQQEGEAKMIALIEENDMDVQTFNSILKAKQTNSIDKVAPEQLEAFEKTIPHVMNEQQKVNAKIEQSLGEEGLDMETYEGMMLAYQQVPEFKERIDKLLADDGS